MSLAWEAERGAEHGILLHGGRGQAAGALSSTDELHVCYAHGRSQTPEATCYTMWFHLRDEWRRQNERIGRKTDP